MKVFLRHRIVKLIGRVFSVRRCLPVANAGAAILAGALMFSGPAMPTNSAELIQNGSFELNNGLDGDNSGFGWFNPDDAFVFDVYSHATQVYYDGPSPDEEDGFYFHTVGINNPNGIFQDVDLTAGATPAEIDAGTVAMTFTAYLAGYTLQDDHPRLTLELFDEIGESLGSPIVFDGAEFGVGSNFLVTVSGLEIDDPSIANPISVWKLYGSGSGVPVGARSGRVTIFQDSITGNGNDNYVDLVSLVVSDTGSSQFLTLEVNTDTGLVSMLNPTAQGASINYYEVLSNGSSLDPDGWQSFDDQNIDAIGKEKGQSWDEGGAANVKELVEAFFLGSSLLEAGERISLGRAYDPLVDAQDLRFSYGLPNDVLILGTVTYVQGGLRCDFDDSGTCDTSDIDSLLSQGDLVAGIPAADAKFDLTGDNVLNGDDITAWLSEAGSANGFPSPFLDGDATLDGIIDSIDLNAVGISWLDNGKVWSTGDFNGDGLVNALDLNILGINWRKDIRAVAASNAVPEPHGLVLICLAGIVGLILRR